MNSLLTISDLTISQHNKILCDNLSLEINRGDRIGIIGQNGSGKTTLLHTLARLQTPLRGDILLKEKNIKTFSTKSYAQHVGILLQDTQVLFPQTVIEYCLAARFPHLSYFAKITTDDLSIAERALYDMELNQHVDRLVTKLSGGEQRRLHLAALLTQNPLIFLLDEPTNHLDVRHQIKVLSHFEKNSRENNHTVIMSLHDINLAERFCNRVLMLFGDGSFLIGPPSEVFTEIHLTRLYGCRMQFYTANKTRYWLPAD